MTNLIVTMLNMDRSYIPLKAKTDYVKVTRAWKVGQGHNSCSKSMPRTISIQGLKIHKAK